MRYIDPDGRENEELIKAEGKVTSFLEVIKNNPSNYSFDVYQRRALGKGKRSDILLHSLYIITNITTGEETTLSFNGTKTALTSTGAWATNTEMDVASYQSYKKGDNSYDMIHLISSDVIDSGKTTANIIKSIKSDTTYFALDHKINDRSAENCNTALFHTLAIQQSLLELPILRPDILPEPNSSPKVIIKEWR